MHSGGHNPLFIFYRSEKFSSSFLSRLRELNAQLARTKHTPSIGGEQNLQTAKITLKQRVTARCTEQ